MNAKEALRRTDEANNTKELIAFNQFKAIADSEIEDAIKCGKYYVSIDFQHDTIPEADLNRKAVTMLIKHYSELGFYAVSACSPLRNGMPTFFTIEIIWTRGCTKPVRSEPLPSSINFKQF